MVRLGRHAVRAVGLRGPRLGRRGGVLAEVPRGLHRRRPRPDARLVLLPDGGGGPAVRAELVPQRDLPRPRARRRGPQDVEAAGQCHRSDGRLRAPRRRRGALVHGRVGLAVGRPTAVVRSDRRRGPALRAHPVEHVRLLRDVREHRPAGPACGAVSCRASSPRPLDVVATARRRGPGHRRHGRLRRHRRRPATPGAGRRPVELVRPPVPPSFLGHRAHGRRRGRQAGRVRHAARVPGDDRADARAVHAVRDRGDLREPRGRHRRRGGLRPPE
jgi:hypothetical protein